MRAATLARPSCLSNEDNRKTPGLDPGVLRFSCAQSAAQLTTSTSRCSTHTAGGRRNRKTDAHTTDSNSGGDRSSHCARRDGDASGDGANDGAASFRDSSDDVDASRDDRRNRSGDSRRATSSDSERPERRRPDPSSAREDRSEAARRSRAERSPQMRAPSRNRARPAKAIFSYEIPLLDNACRPHCPVSAAGRVDTASKGYRHNP